MKKWCNPLFIIGNPRSGTSMLRLILTTHSKILVPPECGFIVWLHKKYADWQLKDNNQHKIKLFVNDLVKSKKFETWQLNKSIVIDQINVCRPASYAELCWIIYNSFGLSKGEKYDIWGDKNNFHINHLEELLSIYDNARFLHIVRDGRDVACSYREVMAIKSKSPYAPELTTILSDIALEWVNNVSKIDSFVTAMPMQSVMTIRYEDLVSNPSVVLQSICDWLNISYENEMLNFHQHNRSHKLEPALTMDWKKRTKQPISDITIGRYLDTLDNYEQIEFQNIAENTLSRFSYI